MSTHFHAERGLRPADEAARRRVVRLAGAAGIVGPVLFTLMFVVQALFKPGYNHVADPVSALAAGPYGWVQDVNFLILGPLMTTYAAGIHLAVRRTPRGSLGPALLVLSGLGLVLAGLFPARDGSGEFAVGQGHLAAAFTSFLPAGIGLVVLSRRLTRDASWRSLAPWSLASGVVVTVLFLATGPLAVPDDAPLHAWGGLLQRATVAVWFSCTILLASRLLHVTRVPAPADGGPRRPSAVATGRQRRRNSAGQAAHRPDPSQPSSSGRTG